MWRAVTVLTSPLAPLKYGRWWGGVAVGGGGGGGVRGAQLRERLLAQCLCVTLNRMSVSVVCMCASPCTVSMCNAQQNERGDVVVVVVVVVVEGRGA